MQLFAAVILLSLLSQVIGHSYVTSPISRSNQKQTTTGCRGPNCLGPCDVPLSRIARAPIATQRGQQLTIQWPRNNHAGGFIRFAWALTSQSDNPSVFDSFVSQINCHEVGGCKPDDPSDPNGGDSAPSDGSFQPCQSTITVPLQLTDGLWTLQWAWFGGAFALGDYYSCVDYSVSGGPTGTSSPVYRGGDFSNPGQPVCKFFNTDRLHQCVNEPCNMPVFPLSAQQTGAPFNFPPSSSGSQGSSSSGSHASGSSSSSSGSQGTSSSGSRVTSSSGSQSTSSSGPKVTSSSGSQGTSSSGSRVTSTSSGSRVTSTSSGSRVTSTSSGSRVTSTSSGSKVTSTSSSGSSSGSTSSFIPSDNSACQSVGSQRCVDDSQHYQTCSPMRDGSFYWAPVQSCQSGLSCNVVGRNVYCY